MGIRKQGLQQNLYSTRESPVRLWSVSARRANPPPRDFRVVQSELELTVQRLKKLTDPEARRKLLRHLKLLIEEADEITHSE